MIIELPLSSDPAQIFTTQLGSVKYDFEVRYNDRSGAWTLDMADNTTKAAILSGVPLVLGQELFAPYNLNIGRIIVVDTNGTSQDATADANDLGTRVRVYWFSDDEVLP